MKLLELEAKLRELSRLFEANRRDYDHLVEQLDALRAKIAKDVAEDALGKL